MPQRFAKTESQDHQGLQRMYGYFWCHEPGKRKRRKKKKKPKHERKWQSAHVYCRPRTPQEPRVDDAGKWTPAFGQKCLRCKKVCLPYRVEYIRCFRCGSTEQCGCCRRCGNVKQDCTCCPKCRHTRRKCTCCKVCHFKCGECTCCVNCKRLPGLCICQRGGYWDLLSSSDVSEFNDDVEEEPDEAEDRRPNTKRPHLRNHRVGQSREIYSNSVPLSPPHWPYPKRIRPPSWPRVAVASSVQNTKLFTWRT